MDTKGRKWWGGRGVGVMNWETGIDIYTLIYIKWITNKSLLYKIINKIKLKKKKRIGASLVAQWLRICLPIQGTRVRALVWEDPTCHGATGPMNHNY